MPSAPRALPAQPGRPGAHHGTNGTNGTNGAPGATGAPGPQGAAGSGSGSTLQAWDSSNASLGQVISDSEDSVNVLTSAGFEVDFRFDGTVGDADFIWYTQSTTCASGALFVNDVQGEAGDFMNPNQLFWTLQGFAKVSNTASQAISGIESNYNVINSPSVCAAGGGNSFGWPLTLVSNATAGLPSSIPTGTIVLSATQP